MSRRSSSAAKDTELAQLRAAVQQLIDHVACLTAAVDELTDQIKWRNNNRDPSDAPVSPRFVLTSMPRDPAAREFAVNRVPRNTIERLRDELSQLPTDSARTPIAHRDSRQSANPQQSLFD